jgi:hypothetical protein
MGGTYNVYVCSSQIRSVYVTLSAFCDFPWKQEVLFTLNMHTLVHTHTQYTHTHMYIHTHCTQGKAEVLALAKRMLHRKEKESIMDAAYNRYAFHDTGMPRWFTEDESRHMRCVCVCAF